MPLSPHSRAALERTPVCSLPCSARFAIWCIRVAAHSVQGCELAHRRLHEVHDVLRLPEAIEPLEQSVRLLIRHFQFTADLGGFGTLYPTDTESRILDAVECLQRGERPSARATLSPYLEEPALSQLVECLRGWARELIAMGAVLSPKRTAPTLA